MSRRVSKRECNSVPLPQPLPPHLRHLVELKLETTQVFYIAFFDWCCCRSFLCASFCWRSSPFSGHRVLPKERKQQGGLGNWCRPPGDST